MRRLLGVLLTGVLLVPALTVLANGTANYEDTFDGGDYSGNSGSLVFDGPWAEFGDSGGHSSGKVHVDSSGCSGECANIDGGLLGLLSYGLQRSADLSMLQSVDLSFDVEIDPDPLLGFLNTATLQVQVLDGGWVTVATYPLNQSRSHEEVINVSAHANENFAVRFRVPDVSLTYLGTATIDNVQLSGTVVTTTTTTTTSTTSTTTTTTTTTPSTPTTSAPTTTSTTRPGVSGQPTSTTSQPTSSTTPGATSTTTLGGDSSEDGEETAGPFTTTTTVVGTTTSTSADEIVVGAPGSPPESGLRDPGLGLMANFESGMMGDVSAEGIEVLSAELTAEFSIAAETFRTARIWIAVLALLMAVAVVGGMDRRRFRRQVAGQF